MRATRSLFFVTALAVALVACSDSNKKQPTADSGVGPGTPITSVEAFIEALVAGLEKDAPAQAPKEDQPWLALATDGPLPPGDSVTPAFGPRGHQPTASHYFAYIDTEPGALFGHDVTYLFADAATGARTVEAQRWWPTHGGTALAMGTQPLVQIFNTLTTATTGAPATPSAMIGTGGGAAVLALVAIYPDYAKQQAAARVFLKLGSRSAGLANIAIDLNQDGTFQSNEWVVKNGALPTGARAGSWIQTAKFQLPLDGDKKFPNAAWVRAGVFEAAVDAWDGSCPQGGCRDGLLDLTAWIGPSRDAATIAAATPGIVGPVNPGVTPSSDPVPSATCKASCKPDEINIDTACKALVVNLGDNPGQSMLYYEMNDAFTFFEKRLGTGAVERLHEPDLPTLQAKIKAYLESIKCLDEAHLYLIGHGFNREVLRGDPAFAGAHGGIWLRNHQAGQTTTKVFTVTMLDDLIASVKHCPKTMEYYSGQCRQQGYCNLSISLMSCYSGNFVRGEKRIDLSGINILTAADADKPGWGQASGAKAGVNVGRALREAFKDNAADAKPNGDGDGETSYQEALKWAKSNYDGKGVTDPAKKPRDSNPQSSYGADCSCVCDQSATACAFSSAVFAGVSGLSEHFGLVLTPEMCLLVSIAEVVHSALGVALKAVAHDHTTLQAWYAAPLPLKLALLQQLFYNTDFPCGASPNGYTLCPQPEQLPPEGDYLVLYQVLEKEIPLADTTNHYVYGFVFDADGVTTNNYQAPAQYPNDFYDKTDRWYEAKYTPSGGWVVTVSDAIDGKVTPVTSAARVIISGNTLMLVVPKSEFGTSQPKFRLTAFRHTGDYGINPPHNWDGSLWPAVKDGLQAMPTPPGP